MELGQVIMNFYDIENWYDPFLKYKPKELNDYFRYSDKLPEFVVDSSPEYLTIVLDALKMERHFISREYRPLCKAWWDQSHGAFKEVQKSWSFESWMFIFDKVYPGMLYEFYVGPYDAKLYDRLAGRIPSRMPILEFRKFVSIFTNALIKMQEINCNLPPSICFLELAKVGRLHPFNFYIEKGTYFNGF